MPYLAPRISNTFTAWLLDHSNLQVPGYMDLVLALLAPGWFAQMPANP